jgi:hypothetical protein
MAYKPSEMTASQIQTELGIDGRKLGQYLARINPIRENGKFKYYLIQDVIEAIYKNKSNIVPIDELKKKKLNAEAELAELEVEKEKGSLIPVKYIERQWANLVIACKSKLLSIPTKLAPVLANETDINICKNMMEEQINQALMELSKGDDIETIEPSEPIADVSDQNDQGVPTSRTVDDQPIRKQE